MDTPQPSPPPDPSPSPAPPPPGPAGPTQPTRLLGSSRPSSCSRCQREIAQGAMAHGRVGDLRVRCEACGPLPEPPLLEQLLERSLRSLRMARHDVEVWRFRHGVDGASLLVHVLPARARDALVIREFARLTRPPWVAGGREVPAVTIEEILRAIAARAASRG